jgi:hypothetical protein
MPAERIGSKLSHELAQKLVDRNNPGSDDPISAEIENDVSDLLVGLLLDVPEIHPYQLRYGP